MKKVFLYVIIALTVCFSVTGCGFSDLPNERHIFNSDNRYSLSDYHIDYLELSRYSNNLATIYDYDDMTALFDMANALVLKKSHESNDLPADFDILCWVGFVREYDDRADEVYSFYLSTTGEICYLLQRIAALSVVYIGNSTDILNEVNRLIELYS